MPCLIRPIIRCKKGFMRVTAMVHNLKLGFKSGGSRSRQDLDELGNDDDDLDYVGDDTDKPETTEGAGPGLSPLSSRASSLSDTRSPRDTDNTEEKEIKQGTGLLLDVFMPAYCDPV